MRRWYVGVVDGAVGRLVEILTVLDDEGHVAEDARLQQDGAVLARTASDPEWVVAVVTRQPLVTTAGARRRQAGSFAFDFSWQAGLTVSPCVPRNAPSARRSRRNTVHRSP